MAYQQTTNPFYKGNQFLPKAGSKKNITQYEFDETMKCMEDPCYFAEKYFKIVHQDAEDGVIPLKLFEYQREAIDRFVETNRLLMATARQVGKTTVATVLILWVALFNKRKNIALLADKEATAIEVLDRIKIAYEYLPDFLKGGVQEWNKKSVTFENGSKIIASATSSNAIRGKSIFFLYIDEAAHVEDWDTFAAAVLPTVSASKKSKIVLTSTPNGMNHFYNYYEAAKNKISEYPLIEVPWWKVEGRDEAWKQKTLADLNYNLQKFAQEQEVEFLGSSGTLISGGVLKILEKKVSEPVHQDRGLRMYQPVRRNGIYIMICDVSRGKNLDYNAFHVIDISQQPYQQVCVYHNNETNATDYAAVIDRIGRYYNEANVLVELNDNGGAVIDLLFMYHGYENLLMTQSNGVAGKVLSSGFGGKNVDRGVRTTAPVRQSGCAMIKMVIEQDQLQISDKATVDELKTFSAKKTPTQSQSAVLRYEAEAGKHDDLVMGLVLFGWVVNQPYFKAMTDLDVLQQLRLVDEDELEDQLLPFGIINSGLENQSILFDEVSEPGVVSGNQFDDWLRDS